MATSATNPAALAAHSSGSILDQKLSGKSAGKWGVLAFSVMLVGGLVYIATRLTKDLSIVHSASITPYILLGVALLIALGFEFVNGFHDTANAVATVIYTHSLEPHMAVAWSGIWNRGSAFLSLQAGSARSEAL